MAFQVSELSIQLVDALVPLMPRIKQRDKSLADQLARAASSISLNCGEAAQCAEACGGVADCAADGIRARVAIAEQNPSDPLADDAR